MQTRKSVALAVVSVSIAAMMAGCSSSSSSSLSPFKSDPKEAVQKAIVNQEQATSSSVKTYLQADPSAVAQFIKDSTTEKEDKSTQNTIKALMTSSVIYEAKSNTSKPLSQGQDLKDVNFGVFVDNMGTRVVSLLGMNNNLFIQADVKKFGQLTETMSEQEYESTRSQIPSPWMKSFFEGKWIGLDEELSKEFSKNIDEQKKKVSDSTLNEEQRSKIAEACRNNFLINSTFANEGDYVKADVPVKKVINQYVTDIQKIAPNNADSKSMKQIADSFKDDARINVFMKIEDNKFSQIKFDTAQVANATKDTTDPKMKNVQAAARKYNGTLVMDLTDKTVNLNVPSGYTKVTQQDLQGLIGEVG